MAEKRIRSARDFCETFFPKAHAEKRCPCYPKPKEGILVIQPRQGRSIRVVSGGGR